jgi:hypothetical protein
MLDNTPDPDKPKRRRKVAKAIDEKAISNSELTSTPSSSTLPRKENGRVNWRALIDKKYLALNRMSLAAKGISADTLSEEDEARLIEESPEEDLVIKLAGFRELADLRGFSSLEPKVVSWTPEHVVVSVTITWLPHEDFNHPLTVGAIASASILNTDNTFSKFLETIAENRAFIRAVRHSLGIVSLGQDEFKLDEVKVEAQNTKIQSFLSEALKNAELSIDDLKIIAANHGFTWNEKWTSVEKIDPAAALSFIGVLKEIRND